MLSVALHAAHLSGGRTCGIIIQATYFLRTLGHCVRVITKLVLSAIAVFIGLYTLSSLRLHAGSNFEETELRTKHVAGHSRQLLVLDTENKMF